jgi:hypothetical protein
MDLRAQNGFLPPAHARSGNENRGQYETRINHNNDGSPNYTPDYITSELHCDNEGDE